MRRLIAGEARSCPSSRPASAALGLLAALVSTRLALRTSPAEAMRAT